MTGSIRGQEVPVVAPARAVAMDHLTVAGFCAASAAVAAAASVEPPRGPYGTCLALALCLAFNLGVALVARGAARRR